MPIPVLLAEDNPFNQELVIELLADTPYVVTVAENGSQALDLYRRGHYRVVLMDCQMPVMDGLEASREIRRYEQEAGLPRTPIIAVTANVATTDRDACLAVGMDDYLAKPFDLDVFLGLLQRWSASRASA
jgi:CheY-like chemotaxis protein